MRELHGDEVYRSEAAEAAAQMKALVSLLSEVNELTKNGGVKELLQLKRENLALRRENEQLRAENLRLLNMNAKKDKDAFLLDHHANYLKLVASAQQEKDQRDLARDEAKQPKAWMRKTDSDWKTNASHNEYAPERLPKNNSDNKLALGLAGSRPDAPTKPRDQPTLPGRLYDRVKETMNHKAIYSNSVEKQPARDPRPQPQPQPVPPGAPQRNSSKKPSNAYLLNESMERNQRRVATESSYNNYLNPAVADKRGQGYIRKPKNEPSTEQSTSGNGSKLRTTLLKRIIADDPDLLAEEGRRFTNSRYSSGSSNQRDYSLEQYKKLQAKDRGRDFDALKENIRDLKDRDRSGSRSIGRSVKPIELSNDRINIGKVLYQRADYLD